MNIVDGVLWGLMLLSAALGFWRGVVKEFFSLVSWVLSFVLCATQQKQGARRAGRQARVL